MRHDEHALPIPHQGCNFHLSAEQSDRPMGGISERAGVKAWAQTTYMPEVHDPHGRIGQALAAGKRSGIHEVLHAQQTRGWE